MLKQKIVCGVVGIALLGAALSTGCGSSNSKKALPPSEGGEGGEAPSLAGGSAGRAGALGAGSGGVGNTGGARAEAGASPDGGVGGTEDSAAGSAGALPAEAGSGGEGGAASDGRLLYNTGVDGFGVSLPGGSVDPHYTLIQSPDSDFPGPTAIVTSEIAEGYWLPQSESSKWIAPTANQSYPGATPCNAMGTYVWRTTFDLTGYDPSTLKITGGWAADNSGPDIRLNGTSLGISAGSYNPLTAFTIEAGFTAGINTLDFEVADVGCPNGLRVELSASFAPPTP